MDEIWQRHKPFILQMIIVGLVFLIGVGLMSSTFSGATDDPAELESRNKSALASLKAAEAPSPKSIEEQVSRAKQAEEQMQSMAAKVASLKTGDDYVRENLGWIAATIGKDDNAVNAWFTLYRDLPQTCLSKVREEVRGVLVARAAQQGKQIDENLGLTQGYEDSDVPTALHGLAIISDLIGRVIETDGIDAVGDLRINAANALSSDLPWIVGFKVHISFSGDPDAVNAILRSFNNLANRMQRMTVVDQIESWTRPRREDDAVKAQIMLLGLQFKGAQGGK